MEGTKASGKPRVGRVDVEANADGVAELKSKGCLGLKPTGFYAATRPRNAPLLGRLLAAPHTPPARSRARRWFPYRFYYRVRVAI